MLYRKSYETFYDVFKIPLFRMVAGKKNENEELGEKNKKGKKKGGNIHAKKGGKP